MHRKPLAAIAAALSVLVLAGMAFAHGAGPSSVQATSATFVATTVADSKSDTCTGADGTYTRTRARYTGMATSTDARLAGAMELRATTVYNATTNLGVVDGHFRIQTTAGHTDGKFRAVDTGGSLAGFADGNAKGKPHAKLLANLSATFDPATGFSAAQLGGGSAPDTAVFVSGRCEGSHGHEHGPTGASGPSGPTGATGAAGPLAKHGKHGKHGAKGKHGKHGKHGHKH